MKTLTILFLLSSFTLYSQETISENKFGLNLATGIGKSSFYYGVEDIDIYVHAIDLSMEYKLKYFSINLGYRKYNRSKFLDNDFNRLGFTDDLTRTLYNYPFYQENQHFNWDVVYFGPSYDLKIIHKLHARIGIGFNLYKGSRNIIRLITTEEKPFRAGYMWDVGGLGVSGYESIGLTYRFTDSKSIGIVLVIENPIKSIQLLSMVRESLNQIKKRNNI